MSNKQSSVVDWIFWQLPDEYTTTLSSSDVYRRAKAMHKDEIEEAELRGKEIIIIKHTENLTPIELPSDKDIWEWWQTQKFQKEQGEQEYTMLYEIDLPKILKAFIEHFNKIQGGNK